MAISPTTEEVNRFHLNSDKDSSATALHHTLGIGPSQASPGNHSHDGKNSKRIKFSDIEGGWIIIYVCFTSYIYTPIPHMDGGSV